MPKQHQGSVIYKNFGNIQEGSKKKAIKKFDGSYHDLILMSLFVY